jgi:hypothetical protein
VKSAGVELLARTLWNPKGEDTKIAGLGRLQKGSISGYRTAAFHNIAPAGVFVVIMCLSNVVYRYCEVPARNPVRSLVKESLQQIVAALRAEQSRRRPARIAAIRTVSSPSERDPIARNVSVALTRALSHD